METVFRKMISKRLELVQIFVLWTILRKTSGEMFPENDSWLENANLINSYIDFSIDPCTDFYQYACGNWSTVHSKVDSGDVLGLMEVEINKQIRDLLLKVDLKREGKGSAILKAKHFYQSCIISTNDSIRLFLDNLEPLNNFNLINSTEAFDWISVIANLRLYGVHVFIEELVLPHWNDSTKNFIYIDKANFTSLPKHYYLNKSLEHFLLIYKDSIGELLSFTSFDENEVIAVAEELVDFEKKLASILLYEDENSDEAEEMVLGYLSHWIPQIDWVKYFSIILGREVDLYETVIVISPGYFPNLAVLVAETQPRVLLNYFKFRALASLDDFKNFSDEDCTNILRNRLGKALSAPYVKKYYDNQTTGDILSMIEEIKSSFNDILENISWLDAVTKSAAKHKLHSTLLRVSLNEDQKYLNLTDYYYRELDIDPNNFYRSYWNVIKHEVRKDHEKLLASNNRSEHDKSQAVANAYYLKTQNLVIIPAGLLQTPVFNRKYPKSYNYGVLGTIIGHELSHGFDYSGKDYDAEGNIRTWWDDETILKYNARMQCMIDQYNKYTENGLRHATNGENTISENIADNCGLRLAYQAYTKLGEPMQNVNGLYFTNNQMFFLSYAQFFCSELENSVFKNIFSEHSIDRYRVIGTLSNMEEFAKEYNCPPGSPMNPALKCRVW